MNNKSLYHSGTKGMHWGIRRYQNEDGSLTPAGKIRYANARAKKYDDRAQMIKANADYRTNELKSKHREFESKVDTTTKRNSDKYKNLADYQKAMGANKLANKNYQRSKDATKYAKDWKNYDREYTNNKIISDRVSSKIQSDYYTAKAESIRNKDYKKSKAYKKARNDYWNLQANSFMYGTAYGKTIMADSKTTLSKAEKKKWTNS